MTYVVSFPADFPGTDAEKQANRDSHVYSYFDPEDGGRCMGCDCRPGSRSSDWPCGADVPREEMTYVTVPVYAGAS